MATSPSPIASQTPITDFREHWFDNEEAIYLNLAGQSPMPKVSFRAVQASLEWKKFPQRIPDTAFFDAPNRIRTSIAKLINAQPQDIALTGETALKTEAFTAVVCDRLGKTKSATRA